MSDPQAAPHTGVRLVHSYLVGAAERRAIRALCDAAFDGDFDEHDFDHCLGGMHALCWAEDTSGHPRLLGHASVIARSVVGDDVPLRCGYVEAVAVHPGYQRRGIGDALMSAIGEVIVGAYDLGALGTSAAGRGLYLRHGWLPWRGELACMSPCGLIPTPDDAGAVMVLPVPGRVLDLGALLACDWRAGDVW